MQLMMKMFTTKASGFEDVTAFSSPQLKTTYGSLAWRVSPNHVLWVITWLPPLPPPPHRGHAGPGVTKHRTYTSLQYPSSSANIKRQRNNKHAFLKSIITDKYNETLFFGRDGVLVASVTNRRKLKQSNDGTWDKNNNDLQSADAYTASPAVQNTFPWFSTSANYTTNTPGEKC